MWPDLANRVFFAEALFLSANKMEPTWFLEPSCPLSLW
jgi:hypothetical protein